MVYGAHGKTQSTAGLVGCPGSPHSADRRAPLLGLRDAPLTVGPPGPELNSTSAAEAPVNAAISQFHAGFERATTVQKRYL